MLLLLLGHFTLLSAFVYAWSNLIRRTNTIIHLICLLEELRGEVLSPLCLCLLKGWLLPHIDHVQLMLLEQPVN